MTWHYAYTPYIWPSVCTVLLLIVLAVFTWRRRSVPGALPFMFGCLFAALWAAGSVMEYAAVAVATKVFWIKFQAFFQGPYVTAITCFFLEYAWPGRWLTRRMLVLLSLVPLLAQGLILTDGTHHLMWRSFGFNGSVIPVLAPAGWLFIVYGYGLGIVNIIVAAWLFIHSLQHRLPVVIMLTGLVAGRAVYLLERAQVLQVDLPLDVLAIGFAYLMYAIALFGFRLFDPVALARQTLMEQLSDGMLVLDQQGRVASLNPAAEKIFGFPARQVQGRPVGEILPACPDELLSDESGAEMEFSLSREAGKRDYRLAVSRLSDWHGQETGRLLLLRDVTEQKRAQAQLLEQQRALSAMTEREQVGRELHDELSQNLAFINLQAQAAGDLLAAGDSQQAGIHLARLAAVAREAQVDVRGQISELSLNYLTEEGFVGALRRFIETFSRTYGIQAELILPETEPAMALAPTAEVQVLRIIQETFTNIRKHACARHARVTLATTAAGFELIVADDGQGFDPQERSASGKTFGLRIMQERAAEIGGSLQVESEAGHGTRVIVRIPR